jgi:hypothetical protein
VVHCVGGRGRTGTVPGCALRESARGHARRARDETDLRALDRARGVAAQRAHALDDVVENYQVARDAPCTPFIGAQNPLENTPPL